MRLVVRWHGGGCLITVHNHCLESNWRWRRWGGSGGEILLQLWVRGLHLESVCSSSWEAEIGACLRQSKPSSPWTTSTVLESSKLEDTMKFWQPDPLFGVGIEQWGLTLGELLVKVYQCVPVNLTLVAFDLLQSQNNFQTNITLFSSTCHLT